MKRIVFIRISEPVPMPPHVKSKVFKLMRQGCEIDLAERLTDDCWRIHYQARGAACSLEVGGSADNGRGVAR